MEKSSTDTKTPLEYKTLDKRMEQILDLLTTVEDKLGTHDTTIRAGQLNISHVDLLMKRALVLSESTNRYWNVKSKGSDTNAYIRKNKEAYLLLKQANSLDPYNVEVLLLMAKVQAKLTPNSRIKMQKILYHLKEILDMPENDIQKFQLAQTTFFLAIYYEPIDDQLLQDARIMFEKLGRIDWLRQCDSLLLPETEKNSRAWADKGWTLGLLQRHQQAIDCFDKALEIDPKNPKALRGKASGLARQQKFEQAIYYYDKALELEPNDYGLYKTKGTVYFYLEKYEEAVYFYDKALELEPSEEDAWKGKAICHYKMGKYEQAINFYDKALEIKSRDEDAWNGMGECLCKLQKHEEAIRCYDKSISIDPDNALVWYNKGLCFESMDQNTNAEDCFKKAKDLDPYV